METNKLNREGRGPRLWLWIVLGVALIILALSTAYDDLKSFAHYMVNFTDWLLQGRLGEFYELSYAACAEYRAAGVGGSGEAVYAFPIYIVFGIWGVPLYFLTKARGIEVAGSFPALAYTKLLFLATLALAVLLVYQICCAMRMDKTRARWGAFLFASSALVFSCVAVLGQADILGINLMLCGLLSYVKNQRTGFVLWFMLAVTFKYYALFLFLPLLLLDCKQIWKVAGIGVLPLLLVFVCDLPFRGRGAGIAFKAERGRQILDILFANKLPLLNGGVPVIVVLLGLLCGWCWLTERPSEQDRPQYAAFVSAAAMACVFFSINGYAYWYLYLAPFFPILIVLNGKRTKELLLLETAGFGCLLLGQYVISPALFDSLNCDGMLLPALLQRPVNYNLLKDLVYSHDVLYGNCLLAAAVVFIGLFLWNSRPKAAHAAEGTWEKATTGWAGFRLGLNAGICLMPLMYYAYLTLIGR